MYGVRLFRFFCYLNDAENRHHHYHYDLYLPANFPKHIQSGRPTHTILLWIYFVGRANCALRTMFTVYFCGTMLAKQNNLRLEQKQILNCLRIKTHFVVIVDVVCALCEGLQIAQFSTCEWDAVCVCVSVCVLTVLFYYIEFVGTSSYVMQIKFKLRLFAQKSLLKNMHAFDFDQEKSERKTGSRDQNRHFLVIL